jgi:hypothetical protein
MITAVVNDKLLRSTFAMIVIYRKTPYTIDGNGCSIHLSFSVVNEWHTAVYDRACLTWENSNSTSNSSSEILPSFGLIWNWQKLRNRRRYIGHSGIMPGATHSVLVNEQGNVGMIFLTNADIIPDNDSSMRIRATLENIQMALFDCFET